MKSLKKEIKKVYMSRLYGYQIVFKMRLLRFVHITENACL